MFQIFAASDATGTTAERVLRRFDPVRYLAGRHHPLREDQDG
jgi:hypothetical protein